MENRSGKGCAIGLMVALAWLGSVVVVSSSGCGDPVVALTAKKNGAKVELTFVLENVNGLEQIEFWDKDKKATLWRVDLDMFTGPVLVYGEVPTDFPVFSGRRGWARQTLPGFSCDATPLPVGREILVRVIYQYDTAFSASGSWKHFSLTVGADGTIACVEILAIPFN